MALDNAANDDKRYIRKKLDYCRDYVAIAKDKGSDHTLVMKRDMAECYFVLGEAEEGEHLESGWGMD